MKYNNKILKSDIFGHIYEIGFGVVINGVEVYPGVFKTSRNGSRTNLTLSRDTIEWLIRADTFIVLDKQELLILNECKHEFKTYVGFTQSYNYCTKCDKKE